MPASVIMDFRLGFAASIVAMVAFVPVAAPVEAFVQSRQNLQSEQDQVLQNRVQGRVMPLRVIERRVITQMRGADYLGNPIYRERSNTYRMTFMRDGQVIRLEVDAQSGRIRSRSDR